MRARRVAPLALLLGGLLASSGCLGTGSIVGQPAPAFSLVTSDGQTVNQTTHLGKYVILDLMATWCGPCKLEVAHLREIQGRYGDQVEIISVGIDPGFDTVESLEAFAKEYRATWPSALDAGRKVAEAYRLTIVPKLIIIDPDGVVVFERQGEVHPAAIARVIDPNAPPDTPGLLLPTALGALLGFLGPFNPYRRFHRERTGRQDEWFALGTLALLGALGYVFIGFVSSRATFGSLFVGLFTLAAIPWWWRVRTREAEPKPGSLLNAGFDRAYEVAPHFMFVLVLGLDSTSWFSFFLPLAAFLAGSYLSFEARERVPPEKRVVVGLAGLAIVALGLILTGARILVAEW